MCIRDSSIPVLSTLAESPYCPRIFLITASSLLFSYTLFLRPKVAGYANPLHSKTNRVCCSLLIFNWWVVTHPSNKVLTLSVGPAWNLSSVPGLNILLSGISNWLLSIISALMEIVALSILLHALYIFALITEYCSVTSLPFRNSLITVSYTHLTLPTN